MILFALFLFPGGPPYGAPLYGAPSQGSLQGPGWAATPRGPGPALGLAGWLGWLRISASGFRLFLGFRFDLAWISAGFLASA